MKPFITLAQASTPEGAELTLHGHDGYFYLRVNRQPLMGTNASESERILAELACARLLGQRKSRVLIGGLGFGFTLKRVLELVGTDALVEVAELLPEVVAWNREFLQAVNGTLLDDPRVRITVGDVFNVLEKCPAGFFDAIVLDVDNGPIAMVKDSNARLYEGRGFNVITRALKPGGRVAFWSSHSDRGFERRLVRAGYSVEVVRAKSHERAKRPRHTIFVAMRAAAHQQRRGDNPGPTRRSDSPPRPPHRSDGSRDRHSGR